MCTNEVFLALIALLFPPLPVWVKRGLCSADSLINLALCCLGIIPGLLHSWYIIFSHPDSDGADYTNDAERGRNARYSQLPQQQQDSRQQGDGRWARTTIQGGSGGAGARPHAQPRSRSYGTATTGRPVTTMTRTGSDAGEVPPAYEDAVKGDNKVQKS